MRAHAPGTSKRVPAARNPLNSRTMCESCAPGRRSSVPNGCVITVPKTRTGDDLWNRFLSVIGVDPAALTIPVPDLEPSLSAAQTEFMRRRLNTLLQPDDIEWRRQ